MRDFGLSPAAVFAPRLVVQFATAFNAGDVPARAQTGTALRCCPYRPGPAADVQQRHLRAWRRLPLASHQVKTPRWQNRVDSPERAMNAGEPAERQTIWLVSPVYYDVESYLMLRQRARDCLTGTRRPPTFTSSRSTTRRAPTQRFAAWRRSPTRSSSPPPILSVTSARWYSDCVACRPCCATPMSW